MTTWLVTGGAGFIGGNFVLGAVGDGIRVVNLDALTYAGNRDTLASLDGDANHVFVHGDIGDRALVAKLLAEHRPDAVVNFAAESHVDRSIDGPAAFIQTNVVGTLALLEAVRDHWKSLEGEAKQAFRFLHVSTDEVYGTLGETGKFSETTPYAPNSPYSASKAGMTAFFESVRLDVKHQGVDVTIIQPGFIKTPLTSGREARMPYLMELDDAIPHFIKAIEKRKRFAAFPWQLATFVRAGKFMPSWLYDRIAGRARYRE